MSSEILKILGLLEQCTHETRDLGAIKKSIRNLLENILRIKIRSMLDSFTTTRIFLTVEINFERNVIIRGRSFLGVSVDLKYIGRSHKSFLLMAVARFHESLADMFSVNLFSIDAQGTDNAINTEVSDFFVDLLLFHINILDTIFSKLLEEIKKRKDHANEVLQVLTKEFGHIVYVTKSF